MCNHKYITYQYPLPNIHSLSPFSNFIVSFPGTVLSPFSNFIVSFPRTFFITVRKQRCEAKQLDLVTVVCSFTDM